MGFLAPHTDKIYAVFRLITGALFMQHGFQKLLGCFGGVPAGMMPDAIKFSAGPIELFGGLLVAIGFFAGPAAFICSGMMAVGYFMAHAGNGFFPILNGGEPAIQYCFAFLFISAKGSGIWSVDALRGK
jgi:putative oxidoreductase